VATTRKKSKKWSMDKWVNNIGIGNTLVSRRLNQSGLSKEDLIIKNPSSIYQTHRCMNISEMLVSKQW